MRTAFRSATPTKMRHTIYVVTFGTKWKVRCEHCNSTVKDTQAEAVRLARKHVAALDKGAIAQIRVQGRDSLFRTEWTYGKDPFPPKG